MMMMVKVLAVYGLTQSGSTNLWARIADRNRMQHLERKITFGKEIKGCSEWPRKRKYLRQSLLNVKVTFGHIQSKDLACVHDERYNTRCYQDCNKKGSYRIKTGPAVELDQKC